MAEQAWPALDLERVRNCPACGSTRRSLLYDALSDRIFHAAPGTWRLISCSDCASAYLDPRPTEASIGRAYESYYTHGAEAIAAPGGPRAKLLNGYLNARWGYDLRPAAPFGRLVGALVPVRATIASREIRHQMRIPGGRLLDVGSGSGAFVAHARRLGWEAEGLDPDPIAVETARRNGIPSTLGRLSDLEELERAFESVTLSHVIEHLHDPVADLRRIHRILVPGGRLWIATPNLLALGHRLFGSQWRGVEPPRHLVLFTPDSLDRLLRSCGFTPLPLPRPAPTARVSFVQSAALRAGLPVYDGARKPSRSTVMAAAVADRLEYLVPRLAEELVTIARRDD